MSDAPYQLRMPEGTIPRREKQNVKNTRFPWQAACAVVMLWSAAASASNPHFPACDDIQQTTAKADRDNKVAQYDLGNCYYNGIGVEMDAPRAVSWFTKAAEQGYAPAQYAMSERYRYGRGVEQNDQKSFEWMKRAAEQNYLYAQTSVASKYATGEGVTKDPVQGANWTRKAADQGSPGDQKLLGLLYETGSGVPKDNEQARYWYEKAASQQVDPYEARSAQRYLDALNKRLAQK